MSMAPIPSSLTPGDRRRGRHLLVLALAAALSASLGATAALTERPTAARAAQGPLFPDLAARSGEIASIRVDARGQSTRLAKGADGTWTVASRDGYPANAESVRKLVVEASRLEIAEARTADPARHGALGLAGGDSGETRTVSFQAADGSVLAAVTLGKIQSGAFGDTPGTMFVRRAGENQTYLVRGLVGTPQTPGDWLDKSLIDLPDAQIRTARFEPIGLAPYALVRAAADQPDFAIESPPEGREPQDAFILNATANAVRTLRFDDVRKAEGLDLSKAARAAFETFDGLSIAITIVPADGANVWALVEATASEDASETAKADAGRIAARASGWAFLLGQSQAAQLATPLESLLKPKSETAAPE